jgi:hypothetical protein
VLWYFALWTACLMRRWLRRSCKFPINFTAPDNINETVALSSFARDHGPDIFCQGWPRCNASSRLWAKRSPIHRNWTWMSGYLNWELRFESMYM